MKRIKNKDDTACCSVCLLTTGIPAMPLDIHGKSPGMPFGNVSSH